jgi:non-heme chloroperoxidase
MSTITTKDGTQIFYKDWGKGPVLSFSHGWPLNSDAWDAIMLALTLQGFRTIAHDRRGHGRSTQTSGGNDMDTYSDDLEQLFDTLDLHDITMVGHSTGGGEVARYIGRHGSRRVAGAVLISAVPPIMAKSGSNPDGLPMELFDGFRAGLAKDRGQLYREFAALFYGTNRPGAKVSQPILDQLWRLCMQTGLRNSFECVKAFSETDFREDLKKFDVPTLVMHGEDDQVVPIDISGRKTAKLVKGAQTAFYPAAPHGITETHQEQLVTDLVKFLRGAAAKQGQREWSAVGANA